MEHKKNIFQPRLLNRYHDEVIAQLSEPLKIKNVMRFPKIERSKGERRQGK